MPVPRLPSPDLGLTWRPISDDLIDIWHGLMATIEAHDSCSERQNRDDLIETLHDGPYKNPARDSLLGRDGAGTARAFGVVIPLPGDTLRRVYLWGGVHPEWRGRGIGRELLRWQTERSHEALAEQQAATDPVSAVKPWRIGVSLETNHPHPGALYEAAGYSTVRWFHDMVRPFGAGEPAIPDRAAPEGLDLAHWTEDIDDAVRLAHNEAFANHWGAQARDEELWRTSVTEHRTFRRDWSRVVLDPTQPDATGQPSVAGYVASYAYPQDWEALGRTEGWIGLIGVRPAWRGRGLAPALLGAAMRAFEADGMDAAALDVDAGNDTGALGLYEGMGFRTSRTHVMWSIESADAAGL
jgi:mycothiol synthase